MVTMFVLHALFFLLGAGDGLRAGRYASEITVSADREHEHDDTLHLAAGVTVDTCPYFSDRLVKESPDA